MIKTRFCPSPTGLMHLGNARTALFNYLFAQKESGEFLLRIEDTDAERSKQEFDRELQTDLNWMGLYWDEGPAKDRGNGPYYQSERQTIYDRYYQRLEMTGEAYPCFCSEEQLKLSRKIQRSMGKPPRYMGTCRSLSKEEVKKKLAAGMPATLRFRVPDNKVITFTDLVRGLQHFRTSEIGDFIIRRANGTSPFMFCNAIDDAVMKVTHVLRGEDHLTNTPRQLLILQSLDLSAPIYGHIALIVGPDGSPLSKRHGSRSIKELRQQGYLPKALINYLARLGHYYEDESFLSMSKLAKAFNTEALTKSPAKFNAQQLDYWQKKAVEQLSNEDFWQWIGKDIKSKVPTDKADLFLETIKPNVTFPEDVQYWVSACFDDLPPMVMDNRSKLLADVSDAYFEKSAEAFIKFDKELKTIMDYLKSELNIKGKALYQPLRVALTGVEDGPELGKLIRLMDDQTIQKRLKEALSENF